MLVLGKDVREESLPVQLRPWDFEGDATVSAVDRVKNLGWVDRQIEVTADDVANTKSTNSNINPFIETKDLLMNSKTIQSRVGNSFNSRAAF